jgi:hypothetical protein
LLKEAQARFRFRLCLLPTERFRYFGKQRNKYRLIGYLRSRNICAKERALILKYQLITPYVTKCFHSICGCKPFGRFTIVTQDSGPQGISLKMITFGMLLNSGLFSSGEVRLPADSSG